VSNNGGVYTWSKTSAANATADSSVNYQEGQAPSTLNDSARNAMASVAKYRDDVSGSIVTTGTSVAYIVASSQVFDTLANFHGKSIAFTPHVTNGAGGTTMTVDTFPNIPLRSSPGKELPAGTLVLGTPYVALYNNTDGALYLQGGVSNIYDTPAGATVVWWDDVLPTNGLWAFANGQIIASANTVCPILLARWGSRFGGNGATTMGVPDLRDTVPVGKSTMGGVASRGLHTLTNTVLGALIGLANTVLVTLNLPAYTPTGTFAGLSTNRVVNSASGTPTITGITASGGPLGVTTDAGNTAFSQIAVSGNVTMAAQGGTSTAFNNVQPSTTCNWILRLA
jgi:microcystin-dependent protein